MSILNLSGTYGFGFLSLLMGRAEAGSGAAGRTNWLPGRQAVEVRVRRSFPAPASVLAAPVQRALPAPAGVPVVECYEEEAERWDGLA